MNIIPFPLVPKAYPINHTKISFHDVLYRLLSSPRPKDRSWPPLNHTHWSQKPCATVTVTAIETTFLHYDNDVKTRCHLFNTFKAITGHLPNNEIYIVSMKHLDQDSSFLKPWLNYQWNVVYYVESQSSQRQ